MDGRSSDLDDLDDLVALSLVLSALTLLGILPSPKHLFLDPTSL